MSRVVRFGVFEADLAASELRKEGMLVKLQDQPFRLLALLLERPGAIVTREDLRAALWPDGSIVDFEYGVNTAIKKVRYALGDTAENPTFIQTLPRKGYRFIAPVIPEVSVPATTPSIPPSPKERWRWMIAAELLSRPPEAFSRNRLRTVLITLCSLVFLVGAGAWFYHRFHRNPADVQIKSLAVLPLEDLSGDRTQDYFADGVTDELITALARINSVKVISRRSVMQYKGVHGKPLPQIARELDVDAVLEGTVARSGDRVRVTAQLIEASTDRHLWANRYERNSRDISLLENEISRAIAEQLRGKLSSKEQSRFSGNPIDPAAHEAYLQGLYLWNRRTQPALKEAIQYFTQAIEKEPRYAAAYAGRAQVYIVLGSWAIEAIRPEEAWRNAEADGDKALELDENSAEAHLVRASVLELFKWDPPGAETEYRRAIELSPSYATARQWYGGYLCNIERFNECLAETARAHALDPAYLIAAVDVGIRLCDARRCGEAIAPIRKVLEFNPDFILGHRALGQVYELIGMYPEAIEELRKSLNLSNAGPVDIASLGHAYAISGHRIEARQALHRLEELAKQRYVSGYEIALIRLGLGENERALESLELAFRERSSWMMKLNVDGRLDPIRGDPRFTDLLRRVGLAQ